MIRQFEEDWKQCQRYNPSKESFNCINLQLHGICTIDNVASNNYSSIYIQLPFSDTSTTLVPRKIPLVDRKDAIYILDNNRIYSIDGEELFPGRAASSAKVISDENKYLNGFCFPFLSTSTPFYELRINPKNTGRCPGQCLFCHREISHRRIPSGKGRIENPEEIVNAIIEKHGLDALRQVNHVSIITELFGSEQSFLDYIECFKHHIEKKSGTKICFRACAQDVRSYEGLKRLHKIVDDDKFSFTLESFTKRELIMSKYKGIPLPDVQEVLSNAKKAGFHWIKLNYVAGIDPLDAFKSNIGVFYQNGLVDMLGLSIFTAFTNQQQKLRDEAGWNVSYYYELIDFIANTGIALYEPYCFDMGVPPELIKRCRIVTNAAITV